MSSTPASVKILLARIEKGQVVLENTTTLCFEMADSINVRAARTDAISNNQRTDTKDWPNQLQFYFKVSAMINFTQNA